MGVRETFFQPNHIFGRRKELVFSNYRNSRALAQFRSVNVYNEPPPALSQHFSSHPSFLLCQRGCVNNVSRCQPTEIVSWSSLDTSSTISAASPANWGRRIIDAGSSSPFPPRRCFSEICSDDTQQHPEPRQRLSRSRGALELPSTRPVGVFRSLGTCPAG